jgi:stearoyl-CoA 9-desaturase NADPH oxidoreductase
MSLTGSLLRASGPPGSSLRSRAVRVAERLTTPLLPADYLDLFDPLRAGADLRGRIVEVRPETPDAVTVVIRPGRGWLGHVPGQYIRIGIDIDGVRHWRAYSLTSDPLRADGRISITPKLVEAGKVSPFLFSRVRPGAIVRLGGVEGTFVLPDPLPKRLLFITAGSGITPVMSMLRSIASSGHLEDVVHVHCARTAEEVIFGRELRDLDNAHRGYALHVRATGEQGRLTPDQLDGLCPDWTAREAFVCGPSGLIEAMADRWSRDGDPTRMHVERFQPEGRVGDGERGTGGTIRFCSSKVEAVSDGEQPILQAGENAGATLPFGCRMGICHTCVGRLRSGQVRDLRTGRVHGQPGEMLRTCVNAPEGAVEIDL